MKSQQGIERRRGCGPALICRLSCVLALGLGAVLIPAGNPAADANSGTAFLKIGTGARPAAMGGAYTALADDVNALSYNPGGLAQVKSRELGATHAEWLLDTTFDFFGYAHPTGRGTFGLGVTRLAGGRQEGRDTAGAQTDEFGASDTAYTLGFSRALGATLVPSGNTSLGGNVKFIQSHIAGYSAQTVAFDLGAQHRLAGKPLSLGLTVLNIGKGMTFIDQTDPLPLTVAVGGAFRFVGVFQLALDVRHEAYENRTEVGLGTEYALLPQFSIRAGYASMAAESTSTGNLSRLTGLGGGFGLKIGRYSTDYSFTPFGQLGNAHRISLAARW